MACAGSTIAIAMIKAIQNFMMFRISLVVPYSTQRGRFGFGSLLDDYAARRSQYVADQ
jgi:hypothetical protein